MGNIIRKKGSKKSENLEEVRSRDLFGKLFTELNETKEAILRSGDTHTLKSEIEELKKQNKALEKLLKAKNERIEQATIDTTNQNEEISINKNPISAEKIEELVDKMLEDPNVNIAYLPDFVERQIYINIFTTLLGVFNNLSNDTDIKLLGHKIKIQLTN